jgi:hypothetical protein
VLKEFIIGDRDVALADENETRKIWAEKYLRMELGAEEADHFALYSVFSNALTEKLKNEALTKTMEPSQPQFYYPLYAGEWDPVDLRVTWGSLRSISCPLNRKPRP